MTMPHDRPAVLITGAGRGIGFATAEAFAEAGYAVVIAERAVRRGTNAGQKLRRRGFEALFVRTDVAKAGHAERAVRATLARFGRLDCLVNNAGVLTIGPLAKTSRAAIGEIVRVNLLGPILMTRAALPALTTRRSRPRSRRSSIVNVSSVLGKEGAADYVAYCATKFGVIGLTEALADELRGTGVSVWAVCPGLVDTPMGRKSGAWEGEEMIPPAHVARAILSLARRTRRAKTGSAVTVLR
jgi:NAD(P)-dependent dehydrogenase (short-subunit alcohol dehydrogenase family)